MFCSGDMALFACHYDWQFSSFSTKNTPMVLGTITNGIVCEPLETTIKGVSVCGQDLLHGM